VKSTTAGEGADEAAAYSPKEYWTGLAEGSYSADSTGFAPVLHPGSPPWFNREIDKLQFRAVRRALALAGIARGARVLDVGCGTGRWVRRYQALGLQATGVDATIGMLRIARERKTTLPLIAGEANRLPLPDAAFDMVSDITVVQHIPAASQAQAIGEMTRVLKPGGRLVLMELIRGQDAHIFPRAGREWIQLAASCGVKLVGWFGQEYLLLDRLFVRGAQMVTGRNKTTAAVGRRTIPAHDFSMARRIYWGVRHVSVSLSVWGEPVVEKGFPSDTATHGVFVFQK
jgi:SAM-dependent methyltransferase